MDNSKNLNRPSVLETASETQIEELERQFAEQDREAWDVLTESYGWSAETGEDVWNWFSLSPRPQAGGGRQTSTDA
jgi:hypothetical protein